MLLRDLAGVRQHRGVGERVGRRRVIAGGHMQRLVDVFTQMEQPTKSLQLRERRGFRAALQNVHALVELMNHLS